MNGKFNGALVPVILALCLVFGSQAMGESVLYDSFDTTADPAGINDELASRQSGSAATQAYSFLTHLGNTTSTAEISGDELLITSRLQGPQTVYSDLDGSVLAGMEYSVSADFLFQPNTGELNSYTWGSIVINETQSADIVASLDLMLLLRAEGTWTLYAGGSSVGDGTIAPSTSYHAELAINETGGSSTVDLIVDGNTLVDDAAWTPGGANRYSGLRYYGYAGTYAMAFDDFEIEIVPEPSTLMLLCMGLVAFVSFGRRRSA